MGSEADRAATLTAIRLRLEGQERASLEDLLRAGKDVTERDPLTEALGRQQLGPASRTPSSAASASAARHWRTCSTSGVVDLDHDVADLRPVSTYL